MTEATENPADRLAVCDWIEEADRAELEALFVWVGPDEHDLPPRAPRNRPHPSLVMLERPTSNYDDADLRLAARLARHLTASVAQFGDWRDASYVSLRPGPGQWVADKTTWTNGGSCRTEFREAVALLASGVDRDLDSIARHLDAFDEGFGHGPAAPAL